MLAAGVPKALPMPKLLCPWIPAMMAVIVSGKVVISAIIVAPITVRGRPKCLLISIAASVIKLAALISAKSAAPKMRALMSRVIYFDPLGMRYS